MAKKEVSKEGVYKGQMTGEVSAGFAEPLVHGAPDPIQGLGGTYDDIGEKSGFQTDGYIFKHGTPYGEDAKFNYLPPGMEIEAQEMAVIHPMSLNSVTEESYPGDGWSPKPKVVVK